MKDTDVLQPGSIFSPASLAGMQQTRRSPRG
jgi:hypothetical protein